MDPERKPSDNKDEEELPVQWKQIQGAVWLLGLALIAWQDWWWPGILVLAAISGLTQAGIQMYISRQAEAGKHEIQDQELARERGEWLPDVCPNCGGPLSVASVHWSSPNTADCPYCKANLKKRN